MGGRPNQIDALFFNVNNELQRGKQQIERHHEMKHKKEANEE